MSNEVPASAPVTVREITRLQPAEIGDLYFSLAQLCRHLGLDPEVAAADGNRKFLRRFTQLEAVAAKRGIVVREASREQLEELWRAAKDGER